MKKLLIILMVVAMAAFLFVGCMPGVTPDVDEDEDEEVVVPTSATPVLTDIQNSAGVLIVTVGSTSTEYINKTELGSSILVKGTAPSGSAVKIYIDDVALASVGETAVTGLWSVAVAKSSLGDDGVKVLHATVTEVGLAESAASNAVTFTLDTDLPGIDSVAFTAVSGLSAGTATATLNTNVYLITAADVSGTTVPVQTFVSGTWTITSVLDAGVANNVAVTSPSGVTVYHSVGSAAVISDLLIPGIKLTFTAAFTAATASTTVTISAITQPTAEVVGRATIKFDEDVNYAGMTAGTYTCATVAGDPDVYNETKNTGYFTNETGLTTAGASATITVYGVKDLAGNVGGTSAVPLTKTATVGAASATSLKP